MLQEATRQFHHKGIKAVKMDDIAEALSISKRTLYEIFGNKEDLALAVVERQHQNMDKLMGTFAQSNPSVIDILVFFFTTKVESSRDINPLFFEDMNKYPKLVAYFKSLHEKRDNQTVVFMKTGVEQGYFRKELNYNIIVAMGEALREYFLDKHTHGPFTHKEVFVTVSSVLFRGICTQKGQDALEKHIKQYSR